MDAQDTILIQLGELKGMVHSILQRQDQLAKSIDEESRRRAQADNALEQRVERLEKQRTWIIGATIGASYVVYQVIPYLFPTTS